jgi:allantoicase
MGYQASAAIHSLPASQLPKDIPHVEALPLTYEAFLPYGRVIQAFSGPTAAPRGIAKTTANQGTAAKYHKMALVDDLFAEGERKKTSIGVIRAQARVKTGSEVDIVVLERHPKTNQAFVPLGQAGPAGAKAGKGSYVVMAALPKPNNGDPDLSTLRVFTVPASQGISFNAGIWHNPLMTADEQMDLACIETFDSNDKVDTDFYRAGGAFARFTLPTSELIPAATASPVEKAKETASNAFSSLKSMLSGSSGNVPCQALTQDAFAEFGHVVQGYDSAESAPSYARVATSEEFKNVKVMDLAPVAETYPAEAGAKTGVSVFRCTPKEGMEKGQPWAVKLMER